MHKILKVTKTYYHSSFNTGRFIQLQYFLPHFDSALFVSVYQVQVQTVPERDGSIVGVLTSWHRGGRRRLFLRQPMIKQITKQKTMIPQTIATEMKSSRLLRLSRSPPPTGGGGNAVVDTSC